MKVSSVVVTAIMFWMSGAYTGAYSQEALIGKYTGNYEVQTRNRGTEPRGMSLTITSAENGNVKGTVNRSVGRSGCSGDTQVEGTYKGNKLELRGKGGGTTEDCDIRLILVHEGNKLTGTTGGQRSVELSK
jgi:hypothetical protein